MHYRKKNSRIEEYIEQLKDKHQDRYTRIQYRLWAEMLNVGTHKSLDDAPCAPIFTADRAKQSKVAQSPLTHALTEVATSFVTAFSRSSQNTSPNPQAPKTSSSSPYKVADLRGKYIQQLKELHSLLEAGAINDDEYAVEKEAIFEQLKTTRPSHVQS